MDIPSNKGEIPNNKYSIFSTKHKSLTCWIDLIQVVDKDTNVGSKDDDGGVDNLGYESISAVLEPGRAYTIGRSNRGAEFVFNDPRVSKQHCQILYDGLLKRLYLLNGALLFDACVGCSNNCLVHEFRRRLVVDSNGDVDKGVGVDNSCCCKCKYVFKGSLNGVLVNGVKVSEGVVVELCVGDEVLLVCASRIESGGCGLVSRVGFVVRRVVFDEELVVPGRDGVRLERPRLGCKRVLALTLSDSESLSSECGDVVGRAKSLLARCNHILRSDDPVSCIRQCLGSHSFVGGPCFRISKGKRFLRFESNGDGEVKYLRKSLSLGSVAGLRQSFCEISAVKGVKGLRNALVKSTNVMDSDAGVSLKPNADYTLSEGRAGDALNSIIDCKPATSSEPVYLDRSNPPLSDFLSQNGCLRKLPSSSGKNFYLNRLESMHPSAAEEDNAVSLTELLHPVDSILRMFIATFTSDIGWFLSYCDIPPYLPITLACHNTERCWSADPGKRSCVPYPDFPNLVVVYPPFPESIAFGKDLKNKGIGCHHPKLLVVQREDFMRVIITSANLVATQWKSITNTIWWQDFPRREFPDCTSLFNEFSEGLTSDFAAQLSGFMATLVTDVPSQAYWILELSKYDFTGASAYLVASVPGVHSHRSLSATLPAACKSKYSERFLGSVEASVVGLSHRFRRGADSSGVQLRKLAAYLGQSSEKGCGMSEVTLRREKNVPQDANAVSVLVSNPLEFSNGDYVQLGFLPRTVAKWVSPLWDVGCFRFHGHICPREAIAAASGESNIKVQMILHVSQGPNARDITKMMEPEYGVSFCSLIASLQRCTGLWRMEEVLQHYKWPEPLESEFVYGSSSIGTSVGAHFLAAFSAAAGKRAQQAFDSQESDPEWSCWNAHREMLQPSIRIIFPSIDRVRNAHCGISPSRRILAFSEKTWQRLKLVDILHDAIPQPCERVGYPMHVKVARRRFKSKSEASSFGWVYCGSHNMSAAAWGQLISSQSGGLDKSNFSGSRLRVCNYELGLIFVFPPSALDSSLNKPPNLDDINLPFVVPAPKYGPRDRPATKRAMWEAVGELAKQAERTPTDVPGTEEMVEEVPDEEDEVEEVNYVVEEAEEERAYADELWHQVDSSQSS